MCKNENKFWQTGSGLQGGNKCVQVRRNKMIMSLASISVYK